MSREMKPSEIDAFERRFGYKPTALPTAIDLLAVYVHRDNPVQGLTLPQLDAIFSKTRRSGYPVDIRTWGQLGLKGAWADKPISLYGRNAASGTYGFFKDMVLLGGDFKDEVKEQPGKFLRGPGCCKRSLCNWV
jgi:phosphate transport system substrate-binding protein